MKVRFGCTLVAFACASLAQTSGGGGSGSGRTAGVAQSSSGTFFSGTYSSSGYMGFSRTGAPYSADQVTENVQTLADGTHITRTMPAQRIYRDLQGRMRTERHMARSMNGTTPSEPEIIEIRDPVDGVAYILDTQGKVAHRVKAQPFPRRPASTRSIAPPNRTQPESTFESLGTQVMEGLVVEGQRIVFTDPIGSMGNDRPLVRTIETWLSKELGVSVLSISSSLQSGVSTTKLINVSRAEPDPDLFRPPTDYTIVDEAGPNVTIHYGQ